MIGGLDYFGIFMGSLMVHYFADRFGRRKSYIGSLIIFILLQCLTTLSTNVYIFCFFRSLQSIAATFVMLLAFILVAEFLPSKYRGFFSKFFSVLAIVGQFFCIGITMIVYEDLLSINWRKLTFFFASITMVLLIIAFLYISESPRFDIFNGDKNRGFATINKMRGIKGKLSDDEKNQIECWLGKINQNYKENLLLDKGTGKSTFAQLMGGKYKKVTLILIYAWFATTSCNYGIEYILPIFIQKMRINSNDFREHPLKKLLFASAYSIPFLIVLIYFTENGSIGRKKSLSFFFFLLFASNFFLSLEAWPGLQIWLVLIKLCSNACFMIIYVYTVELFPTFLRMAALGTCSGFSRIGQTLAPWISIYMMEIYIFSPFLILGTFALFASLVILAIPHETMNKKMESLL